MSVTLWNIFCRDLKEKESPPSKLWGGDNERHMTVYLNISYEAGKERATGKAGELGEMF